MCLLFFFFNDTATTEIYTLSLHDALPIYNIYDDSFSVKITLLGFNIVDTVIDANNPTFEDRKSTRLNSSHANISYAVFCLKKKKKLQHNLLSLNNVRLIVLCDTNIRHSHY